ncbi:XK-related protein [Nesidiocoris tenuis]|uniref:XK-related protein n=1 Tax=Nesidiocoris tenuis TaxID=355587 RepID=A0ABN7A982_9HEMI|nr:XK-related protein [Nesidiocoris tenuis]
MNELEVDFDGPKQAKRKSVTFNLKDTENERVRAARMERSVSVLDRKARRVLNFPLTVSQQLWLSFLMPSIVETTFYVVDIATDLAIAVEFLARGPSPMAGLITLLITYIAPLAVYITQLINPPPENEFKAFAVWFLVETVAFLLYPLRPVQCFAERLFWSIEAARLEDPLREDALLAYEATKTFKIEHYLFLQGIVHAGPQAIFQTVLLVIGYTDNPHIEKMQGLCILTSLMSLSLITTSYQRYETQAKGGRTRVWFKRDEDAVDSEEPTILLAAGATPAGDVLPVRRRWTKVMEEDNPIGKLVAFLFWFLFLLGRILALVLAGTFYPWIVLAVCAGHYAFTLLYILPSPDCKSSIPIKFLLGVILAAFLRRKSAHLQCLLTLS